MVYQILQHSSHLLPILSNQLDVIVVMDFSYILCDVHVVQISLDHDRSRTVKHTRGNWDMQTVSDQLSN